MINARQIRRIGLLVPAALLALVPLLVGQGCPDNLIDPFGRRAPQGEDPNAQPIPDDGSNVAPYFEFTRPLSTIMREVGDVIEIAWLDGDPDNNAIVTMSVDPDKVYGNGTEVVIESNISENADGSDGLCYLDTAAKGLQPGEYRIIATINDGVNPPEMIVAPGLLQLFPPGMVTGNLSPSVAVVQPDLHYGVGHNDEVPIKWCVADPDDGENGVVPDIVVLLDLDQNPLNDLALTGANAEETIAEVCFAVTDPADGPYPITVNGEVVAYVLGCFRDKLAGQFADCADPDTGGTDFPPNGTYTINAMKLPPRTGGEPYRVRVTAWDHTNTAVSRYARGSITVSATATGNQGVVDLAEVGRSLRGTKFVGFDEDGLAGYTGTGVGDMDGDGADDIVIVSRFGRGYGLQKMGSAHLVFGLPGREFGSEVSLNSVTTAIRGAQFTMYNHPAETPDGRVPETNGIVSVARVEDVTGDERPEILFGLSYLEMLNDLIDDDPCDSDDTCYIDQFPNPRSTDGGDDQMSAADSREGPFPDPATGPGICSNDNDLAVQTLISGGYAILVGSDNALDNNVLSLEEMGQGGGISGARFRGAWYDEWLVNIQDDKPKYPYSITPENLFGQTVNTMSNINYGLMTPSARHGQSLLLSSPLGAQGRGRVWYVWGRDFTTFDTIASIPTFPSCSGSALGQWRTPLMTENTQLITGEQDGDMLGYGAAAGDFNFDGVQDITCGAPGADRDGFTDNGIVYVVFARPDFNTPDLVVAWDEFDLHIWNHPRIEIHGNHSNDRFGESQTLVGDVNQDGYPDVAFASAYAGSDGIGGPESGFIGIVFGGPQFAGVNTFNVGQVGGPTLPGVRIYGRQAGGHAGAVLNNVGDFNGDGIEDLAIVAPDEIRMINGLRRKGVAYLLFGGPHLTGTINLSQVGVTVPGLVFVTPYTITDADAAPVTWASGAGDVNSDGFADLLIGIPQADTVYPLNPSLRKIDTGEMYLIYGSNAGTNGF